jgi:hypothetical protein
MMTKFALRAFLAAMAVAPFAAHASERPAQAPALAQQDVWAAIDSQYATIKAALESGNAAPIPFLLAPDFTVTPGNGSPLPSSALLAGMARLNAVPGLHITLNPESFSPTDDRVVVHQNYGVEIPEVDAKGTRHEADVDMSSTDTWVNLGGRWVLKSMVFTHWTARYDGKAVKDLCFGCYPSAG